MHQLSHQHQHHQHEQQNFDEHQPHYHIHEPSQQQLQQQQQQQQHHQHHQHTHHQQQQQSQQQTRKHHSHSPYHSRHTSPHSHHSHSLHTSPHQSHHHVHECTGTGTGTGTDSRDTPLDSPTARNHQHVITTNSSQSSHHHHHHRRRKRQYNHHHTNGGSHSAGGGGGGGGSGNSSGSHGHSHQSRAASRHKQHSSSCTRRHRSATDVSTTSINTCHEPLCTTDREVQEIMVRKGCCTSSRTELAQYFAEDLYGSTRRPSSCCTSSDYCYHTDSTSLYGSRSSLSRNNSIKSASVAMRKKRTLHQRQPSYTSISLRGLNASRPNSQLGSLTSIFDRAKQISEKNKPAGTVVVSPSKITIERQSSSSKDALNKELPDYACSPSPIRWSFLADGKSPTEFEGAVGGDGRGDTLESRRSDGGEYKREREMQRHTPQPQIKRKLSYDERPSTSSGIRKCRDSPFNCDFEQSTTVLFHQEGEAFNNCCNNYIQCNTYLDQDLQITSEDIHQYLSKGNQQVGDILNNSKNYPFQPSNALEFQYKNNFANNNPLCQSEGSSGDGVRGFDGRNFRRNSSKETNLNQNVGGELGGAASSCASTPLSPTNINLSSSSNNINIVFNSYTESNANEVKFINTTRESREVAVSSEAHHSGYLPYTYPTYDYTNMSANSLFDKPIGIDEIPNNSDGLIGAAGSSASDQHSSSLHSLVLQERTVGVGGTYAMDSFDSFDAASDNHLLSQRSSCQFSPQSPRSPLSPRTLRSPATSSISATLDPAFQHHYYQQQDVSQQTPALDAPHHQYHHHQFHYQHQHQHQHRHNHHHSREHFTDGFKISQAFKRVRKRARKYADFLRKK